MSNVLGPVGTRPSSVYWRRRGLVLAVGTVGALVLVRAFGGGAPPEIQAAAAQMAVPLVSSYAPTPEAGGLGPDGLPLDDNAPLFAEADASASASPSVPTSQELEQMVAAARAAATATPTASRTATGLRPSPSAKLTARQAAAKAAAAKAAAAKVPCAAEALEITLRSDAVVYSGKSKPKLFIDVRNIGAGPCSVDLGSRALSFTIYSGKDRIWSSDDCQGKGTSDVRVLKAGQSLEARAVWSKVRSAPGCPKGEPQAKPGTYVLAGSAGGVEPKRRAVFHVR